jgi:hypothetical protein
MSFGLRVFGMVIGYLFIIEKYFSIKEYSFFSLNSAINLTVAVSIPNLEIVAIICKKTKDKEYNPNTLAP